LEGGFVKTGGPNLETGRCSWQSDKRAARSRQHCARRPSSVLWVRVCPWLSFAWCL